MRRILTYPLIIFRLVKLLASSALAGVRQGVTLGRLDYQKERKRKIINEAETTRLQPIAREENELFNGNVDSDTR